MTLEEMKQLDAGRLTIAIAEWMNWYLLKDTEYHYDWAWYSGGENDYKFHILECDFKPLESIDSAVLCVEKLDLDLQYEWSYQLQKRIKNILYKNSAGEISLENRATIDLANASAELRIMALVNTVPEILVRYNQLKENTK